MKIIKYLVLVIFVAALSVAGTYYFSKTALAPAPAIEPTSPAAPSPSTDLYQNWTTISPGGVVDLKIPPGCKTEGAAGSNYISCPTKDTPAPLPVMVISSDGMQVNIRRYQNHSWEYWDRVISTLLIKTPLNRAIQISIEK